MIIPGKRNLEEHTLTVVAVRVNQLNNNVND